MFYRTASLKIKDADPRLCGKDNKKLCNCCETSTCSFRTAAKRLTSINPNYLYVCVSGLHGDEPNENGDYFEWDKNHFEWEKELFGYEGELLNKRNGQYVYETWRGKPNLCNHDENVRVGYIEDVFHVPEEKSVDKLLAVDRQQNPILVKDIEEGRVDGVSMGCTVASSICSKCKHIAYDESDWCECLRHRKGQVLDGVKVYEINKGVVGQECSWITMGAPADPKARERKIIAKEEEMSLSKISRSKEAGTSSDVVAAPGGVKSAVVYESDMSPYTGIKKSKIPTGLSPEMQAKLAFLEKIPVEKLIGLVDDKTAAELTKVSAASESIVPSIDATEELGNELEQINETVPLKVAKDLTNEEIAKTIQTHEVTLKSLYAKEKELIGKPESRRVSAEIVKIEDTITDLKKKVGTESKPVMKEEEMDVKTVAKLVRDAVKEEVGKIVKSQMEEDTKKNSVPESLEKPEVTEVAESPTAEEEPESKVDKSLEDLSESIETKLETTPEEADKLVKDIKDVVIEKLETLTARKNAKKVEEGSKKKEGQLDTAGGSPNTGDGEPCAELEKTITKVLEVTPEVAAEIGENIEELTEEKLEEKAASKKRRAVRRKAQEAVEDAKEDLGNTLEKVEEVEKEVADAVVEEIEDLIETCIEETVSEEDLAKVTVEEEVTEAPTTEEKPESMPEEIEYTAQFKSGKRKSESEWEVSANKKPVFSVSLKQAFEPTTWEKNWVYFKSEQYGKNLTATLKAKGLKKTLVEDLFEVTRLGQAELPPETPDVTTAPAGPAIVAPAASDKLLETGTQETSFGRLLTNIIAPIIAIAGDALKVEDVVSELQATFSDTSAASTFKGELEAKVQALGEQAVGETSAVPVGAEPVQPATLAAYPAKAIKALRKALFEEFQKVKPSMEVSEDEIWKIYSAGDESFKRDLLKEQARTAKLEKELTQLTAELKRSQATVESLLKERSLRFKARKAIELVNKEIEAGWVDNVDSLMAKTKCTKAEAEKTAKEIFDHEVDEITSLDDRSFKQISKKLESALQEEKMGRKASVKNAIGRVVGGMNVSMVEDDKPSTIETGGKSGTLSEVWSAPPPVDENEK